jgi:hypothetical protein
MQVLLKKWKLSACSKYFPTEENSLALEKKEFKTMTDVEHNLVQQTEEDIAFKQNLHI